MSKNKKKSIKPSSKIKPVAPINPQVQAGTVPSYNMDQKQDIEICLVMIVKDEENNIKKCLTQVAPFINYWVIVDTGSKDNTIEVIKETMNSFGIKGELHERPWVNFEVNRTESLNLAKGKCDYRWIIDADDTFINVPGINPFVGIPKNADAYQITYRLGALQYYRAQLVKSDQDWVYKGVLHEYLHVELGREPIYLSLQNCYVQADISPLKRANSLEEKYANDAKILEEALEKEPNDTRYMFYLAQSYRDSDQMEKAIESYQKRVNMGGWEEEVYYSLYMIAKIKEKIGRDIKEVIDDYVKAWEYRPNRLECVFHAMRKLRESRRFLISFAYGDLAIKTRGTSDILFVEPEIWQWRLLDEYSLAAYYIGNPEIALEKTSAIINSEFFKDIDPAEKNRLLKNQDFYRKGAEEKQRSINSQQNV